MVWFYHRLVVHDDPESAGETDPGVVWCAKLGRDGPVDFPHIQRAEKPCGSGQFQAAGIVGDKEIGRCAITLRFEPIDEFRRAGGEEIDLDAGLRRKGVENRFDQTLGAARIDGQFVGGQKWSGWCQDCQDETVRHKIAT